MTGADVSFIKIRDMTKNAPATMATNQKFHLQPFATVKKPPTIGPTHGPMVGPIIQTAIAVPRCSREIRSAMVPPPRTIGAPPTVPIKNLNTMNMLILVETAAAMVKIMKRKLQE
jgi:hypothetical protein